MMKRFQSRATSAAAPDASVIQATIDSNVAHAQGTTWWLYPQYTFCRVLALSDNGGDLLMLTFNHPRHGQIRILYPRAVAAGIRDWLNVALQAPMLRPEPPAQPQPAIEQPPAGTA